jgi:Cu+-exporting ATPase
MDYTTRLGDRATLAHVNYECPCGCTAGLTYDRESGAEHLGRCCCGRLLWVGSDAASRVTAEYEAGHEYVLDLGVVTLPWGERQTAVLAVPVEWVVAKQRSQPEPAQRVLDVVCGMRIDPATAAATSTYKGETYYFCAPGCKQRFDADPGRYVRA